MFELKDLPNYDTLEKLAQEYDNPDIDGLHTWLVWASASGEMLSAFEANLARKGLSQTQFFVLILLKRHPDGLTIGGLANGVAVTSQTMTRVIDRMELAGLCTKHVDPEDRRHWIVRLASQGHSLLAEALPDHYLWVAKFMSHFNETERVLLATVMRKVSVALR